MLENLEDKFIVYKDLDREVANIDNILRVIYQHKFNGVLHFKKFGDNIYVPIVDGKIYGNIEEDFVTFSLYKLNKNFVINYFQLNIKPKILFRESDPVWINLESMGMNIKELFKKVESMTITGFIKIINRIKRTESFIFLDYGNVIGGQTESNRGTAVVQEIIKEMKDYPCDINIYSVSPEELAVYISKYRYIGTAYSLDNLESLINGNQFVYIQLVKPDSVEGYFDLSSMQPLNKNVFYEVFKIEKFPEGLVKMDIDSFITDFDKINVIKPQDMSILFFCPACWSQISSTDEICPNCGFDLKDFHNMDYEYKLLMALEHPVKEWRKNVVHIIGVKRYEEAVPYLDTMADKENDPFILIEIIDTLKKIGTISVIPILEKLSHHKYAIVRNKARQVLPLILRQHNL
ncbi:MAG: HEAT repeat domain-containing protein [Hydrogenothermaceae bacterium]